MDLTSKVKGEELFQLKKLWLDVAKVSHLYIYFARTRMVGICVCSQTEGVELLEKTISKQSHLRNIMK